MTSIRVFGMGQLLTVLPYQFGFYPRNSLLACLFSDGLLGTIRLDAEVARELGPQALANALKAHAQRMHATHLVLLDYEIEPWCVDAAAGPAVDDIAELVEATWQSCRALGIEVEHAIHVRDQHWWSSRCTRGCCPDLPQPVPPAEDVPAVAEYVLQGISPAYNRQAAMESLQVRDPAGQAAVERHMLTSLPDAAAILEEWEAFCDAAGDPTEPVGADMLAAVLDGVADVWLRDEFISCLMPELMGLWGTTMCDFTEDASMIAAHLLRQLPRIPESERPTWLSLLALARWRAADVPGAQLASGLALEEDPQLSLARLVWQLLSVQVSYPDFVRGQSGPDLADDGDEITSNRWSGGWSEAQGWGELA